MYLSILDGDKTQSKLVQLEEMTLEIAQKDATIEKQESIIESQERKISDLRTNIKILKDTCMVLEVQLKDFEEAIVQKCSQVTELVKIRYVWINSLLAYRN
jgi:predicted RNase H-like nuclease (RuvC/YqgF family)